MANEKQAYQPVKTKFYAYNTNGSRDKRVADLRKTVGELKDNEGLLVTRGEVEGIQEDWATEKDFITWRNHDLGMIITGFGKDD